MKPRSDFASQDSAGRRGRQPEPEERRKIERRRGQEEEIQERTAPAGEVVYEAIYREGEHELDRNSYALAWSGLAAGLSMGFSLVSEALLRAQLPDAPWRPV